LAKYTLAFHNPDLLFRQPVKLVDLSVYLEVCGLDQALDGIEISLTTLL
jgi:hypothetical protein